MTGDTVAPVHVGTCGFAEAQETIFSDFSLLEVQKTFYQPPKIETARRWRKEAPADFTFTLKAWQLITHESTSPTYRRLNESLSEDQLDQCGRFRWNETTQKAWRQTQRIADALEAEAVLFQTPKSFTPTGDNLENLRRFLSEIDRRGRTIVFEPRGSEWTDALVADLATDLNFVHGVDPFLRLPVTEGPYYYRLHGRPDYEYRYTYTDDDLDTLFGKIASDDTAFVLFNNQTMADDARRLIERIGKH